MLRPSQFHASYTFSGYQCSGAHHFFSIETARRFGIFRLLQSFMCWKMVGRMKTDIANLDRLLTID